MKRLVAGLTLSLCLVAATNTRAQQPDTQQRSQIRELVQAQQKPWDCRDELRKSPEFTTLVRIGSGVLTAVAEKRALPTGDRDVPDEQVVRVQVIADKRGDVVCVRILDVPSSSVEPKLQSRSLDAVRGWKFKPYLVNGAPVFIDSTVSFHYKGLEVTTEP
jgi:hypothetical protein